MSSLFGEAIRPDLDPAFLLDELRRTRPEVMSVHQAAETVRMMIAAGITPRVLSDFLIALEEHERIAARLEGVEAKLDRIDELITLLDELEVIVRRQ